MKKSSNNYKIALVFAGFLLATSNVNLANAENYYRVSGQSQTPAPRPQNNSQIAFNAYGQEIAPYAYSYANSMPNDGHWRWVDERCYNSSRGNTCVEGHWVRKNGNACEEVSSHSVRTGNYVKIISGGRNPNCR